MTDKSKADDLSDSLKARVDLVGFYYNLEEPKLTKLQIILRVGALGFLLTLVVKMYFIM